MQDSGQASKSVSPTAGTAIFSKIEPKSVTKIIPGHPDAAHVKGRIVTLEYEKLYLIGTYVTNAGNGLKVRIVSSISKYFRIDKSRPLDSSGEGGMEQTLYEVYQGA